MNPVEGLTLDTGALIALERYNPDFRELLRKVRLRGIPISIPAGVLMQVWRGTPRQHAIAVLLTEDNVELVPLDEIMAKAGGTLAAHCGHSDVVDLSVALCAADRGHHVVTSDPSDISRIDPKLPLIKV